MRFYPEPNQQAQVVAFSRKIKWTAYSSSVLGNNTGTKSTTLKHIGTFLLQ